MLQERTGAGELVKTWRQRRRFSQLDLAGAAEVSARHLSFIECGRSAASREMLMRLAESLALPLRERDRLLLAGGYAPAFRERKLNAPDMAEARLVLDAVLVGHQPFPALAVDRRWDLIAANDGVARLLEGVDPLMLKPPLNVLRLSLHPAGLAPRIENFDEWRRHLLHRLRLEAEKWGDAGIAALLEELSALPSRATARSSSKASAVAIPLRIRDPRTGASLSFISTSTVFGTATDITLSELTLESFFPADAATRKVLAAG